MEFLVVLGFIATLVVIGNLYGRIRTLEKLVLNGEQTLRSTAHAESATTSVSSHDSALQDYIRRQLGQGVSVESIKEALLASGWQQSQIQGALAIEAARQTGAVSFEGSIATASSPNGLERFFTWCKEEWLLKLGGLLLLIGFGWLTTYAFLNDWIGAGGRITLGLIAGALFMVLGWFRMRLFAHQGGIFLVVGSTTVLLTVFAAREMYGFFTPLSALGLMFLTTAFVAYVGTVYRSNTLVLASLVSAFIAPLLTDSPSPDYVGLFAYLFVIVLGTLWVTALTGSRELVTVALAGIAVYSVPHIASPHGADIDTLLLFAYAFAGLFFLAGMAGVIRGTTRTAADLVTAVGNGILLLFWIWAVVTPEWQSLVFSAWAVLFMVGAFLVFRLTGRRESFYICAAIGVAYIATATAAELEGAALTVALTVEVAAMVLVSLVLLRDMQVTRNVSVLFLVPVFLSVGSIVSGAWRQGVLHEDFFVLLLLALTLFGLGGVLYREVQRVGKGETEPHAILLVAGTVYAYMLLWLSLHAAFVDDTFAVMLSLVVYTLIGLAAYFYGLAQSNKAVRVYGAVLVGFVVGRLLFVDVWSMEIAGRIVTFFLVGALLVGTAFVRKQKKATTHV